MINVRGLVDDFSDYSREWEQEYDDFPKKAYDNGLDRIRSLQCRRNVAFHNWDGI
jgi:hypothetical protein